MTNFKLFTKERDQTTKRQILDFNTTDAEIIDLFSSLNGGTQILEKTWNIPASGTLPPPPPPDPNKPPVVEAGNDVSVKEGVLVTLDGSASDDGTITSIEWIAPDGVTLTRDPADETKATFTAPQLPANTDLLLLNFTLRVEDSKGLVSTDQAIVTVTKEGTLPPPPPPPPTGLLYNSITVGKWNQARTFTDFDPLFPRPYVNGNGIIMAASGGGSVSIANGELTLKSGAGHRRIYLDVVNFNTQTKYWLKFNDSQARNHTFQAQSRHQQGGENFNKFGGLNHLTDLEEQVSGLKIELYHTSDGGEHIGGGDSSLPFPILVGQWVAVRATDKVDIANKKVICKTEYSKDGTNFQLGHSHTYDLGGAQYAFIFNEALYRKLSYQWYRINPNTTTKGITIKDVSITQL